MDTDEFLNGLNYSKLHIYIGMEEIIKMIRFGPSVQEQMAFFAKWVENRWFKLTTCWDDNLESGSGYIGLEENISPGATIDC